MLKQISLLAPFALGALAQNSLFSPTTTSSRPSGSRNNSSNAEASTTMNLFVEYPPGANFAGSIVDANGCDTTIALVCTEGDIYVGGYSIPCDGQETDIVTYTGSTEWAYSISTTLEALGVTVDYVATEVCTLNPTTSASCSLSLDMSASGEKTKTTSTYSFEGAEAEAQYFQVPITGGADKLRMAPTTCVSADNAAAPTRAARLYKVVVVPGAAALLAAGAAVL